MRNIKLLSLFLFLITSCGRTKAPKVNIYKTSLILNGTASKDRLDTIAVGNDKVDIYFFKKNFNELSCLPKILVDKRYKNENVILWAKNTIKKNNLSNWTDTLTFDSSSRVVSISFSGCIICSQRPYKYNITYNSTGKVDRIYDTRNEKQEYHFKYNDKGDLVELTNNISEHFYSKIVLLE